MIHMISSEEIRKKYLDFFKSKGHTVMPSASLIPENDPTVLFTTAGMHPLVPYLLGEKHPGGNRLTNIQKCIRTGDIDEVGDNVHLTFFEMMGNWSLGDYFKQEAIEYSFEFLTSKEWLGLDKNLLAVSVFQGDNDAPFDSEAFEKWKSLGISEKRIAKLPKKNNWWGPAGETGPCGPDTEMFYWTGDPNKVLDEFDDTDPLWVEIWNDVFMEYNKTKEGTYIPLAQKNVDTGMGLERTVAVLNDNCDMYQIDTFKPIIEKIEELSGKKYGENTEDTRAMRIIADHLRAATFILGDERGIIPSNVGQGYVLRRLIRRAVRYGKMIGIKEDHFTSLVARVVIKLFRGVYKELERNEDSIVEELVKEESKFARTLQNGLDEFRKIFNKNGRITGKDAFYLYQSYGFPKEMIKEDIKELNKSITNLVNNEVNKDQKISIEFPEEEFDEEFKKHQELSRTASAGVFKGGLADNSEAVVKYHTATHLMLQAMREILGDHVEQRGSNLTAERLRFDFSHPVKVTPEEIQKIEARVNEIIQKDLPVHFEILSIDEAKKRGATGIFDEKYEALGNNIKVYFVGDYSAEICGGPHVEHTGVLGTFKIQKEEAVSQGVRRIKATLQ
ncbi:alanine--tRNA ligase [Candidatus Parcubacteria bacterium]|nr:MAG: alanine--tRNA ligase [Candidatus Parcubacteria bacterium]